MTDKSDELSQKIKERIEIVVELYNAGITEPNELAEKFKSRTNIDLATTTMKKYICKARKIGLIERKVRIKIHNKVADLYNSGITDIGEIRKKLELSESIELNESRIIIHLREAKMQGLLDGIPEKQIKSIRKQERIEKISELYNLGITDEEKLAGELGVNRRTVRLYLGEANYQGLLNKIPKKSIERVRKQERVEEVSELYNSGVTDINELVEKLGLAECTVYAYILDAEKQGLIKREIESHESKYERFIKLYSSGITDKNELVEKLEIKSGTVDGYVSRARAEGRIAKKTKKSKKMIDRILKDLETEYPIKVAKGNDVPSSLVYEIIEGLSDSARKDLLRKRLHNNPIYDDVNNFRKQRRISAIEAMEELSEILTLEESIYLARMYYVLGRNKDAIKTLNIIINTSCLDAQTIETAQNEKTSIKKEAIAEMLRKDKDNFEKCLSLCRKYNVSSDFAYDVLGYKIETKDYGEENHVNNTEKVKEL